MRKCDGMIVLVRRPRQTTCVSSHRSMTRVDSPHFTKDGIKRLRQEYNAGKPFRHIFIKDLFDSSILNKVKNELLKEKFIKKSNDLYEFHQSKDLRSLHGPSIREFTTYLYGKEFRSWIEQITGIQTTETIDISAASYTDGSYLQCHDDDLAERRIAFIIYLVPENWSNEDGGSLDLFASDANGNPTVIEKKMYPQWNSIAFFDVSSISHHQVSEVLNSQNARMSISGWFYGSPLSRPNPQPLSQFFYINPAPIVDEDSSSKNLLTYWINPTYLKKSTIIAMQQQLVSSSSLQLVDFLKPELYSELLLSLQTQQWKHVGPPNVASYKKSLSTSDFLNDTNLIPYSSPEPSLVHEFFLFLTSYNFQMYMSMVSGKSLQSVHADVRAFSKRDYTLICDPEYIANKKLLKMKHSGIKRKEKDQGTEKETNESSLETLLIPTLYALFMCVNSDDLWPENWGGYTNFLSKKGTQELISIFPKKNTLSLVYRDDDDELPYLSFVKYVSHHAQENRYDFNLQFL
jgi:prolyl 3-hydroxylase /prolyl 3,4-dihydroxylase